MATPLFRPSIVEALTRFMAIEEAALTRTVFQQFEDVLEYFKQHLEQDGHESLPDHLLPRWREAVSQKERFIDVFTTSQILPAVRGFMRQLIYQQSLLPAGMVNNAERLLHRLGRWLLIEELGSENDYLAALQALPHYGSQQDRADELSSLLFDLTREEPPLGKVLNEVRGYIEVVKVLRGVLILLPVARNDVKPQVRVPLRASSLARSGWWIDARLVQTPQGWQFVDVGNVLP